MKHIRDNAETSIRNAIYLKKNPPENSHIRIISTALKKSWAWEGQFSSTHRTIVRLIFSSGPCAELPSLTGSLLHLILKILELFFENSYFVEQPLDLNL